MSHFGAQSAEGFVDYLRLVRAKKNEIPIFCTRTLEDGFHSDLGKELQYGGLQAFQPVFQRVDLDVREPFGAVYRHKACIVVDLLARQYSAPRHAECRHASPRLVRRL